MFTAVRQNNQAENSSIMSLRDHLLAAQQQQPPAPSGPEVHSPPSHDSQIDPQISSSSAPYSPSQMNAALEPQDPEVRKGRRELSTSKRAAQNRAAQRAFRQRKEQYITSLKSQVNNYEQMATNYKHLEKENLILREYIIRLQSQLLEVQSEIPPAPAELRKQTVVSLPNMMPQTVSPRSADMDRSLEGSPDSAEMDLNAQLQEAAVAAARQIGGGDMDVGKN